MPSEASLQSSTDRDPVELMAEEFLERYRRGEKPSLSEFITRAPEHADDIRELFPALVVMEQAAPAAHSPALAPSAPPFERLGEYRIIREVGRGGMGIVYEAEQEALGRQVALKVLPRDVRDGHCLLRFRREARAAARLHHTNIVPVFDIGEHDGVHFYAMQLIHGQPLDEVIRELRHLRGSRALTADTAPANAPSLAGELLAGEFYGESQAGLKPHYPSTETSKMEGSSILSKASDFSTSSHFHYYRSVGRIGLQVADRKSVV